MFLNDKKGLPSYIVDKSVRILKELSIDGDYCKQNGKRLKKNPRILSIPVGQQYRLVCHWHKKIVQKAYLLTHEKYNLFYTKCKLT